MSSGLLDSIIGIAIGSFVGMALMAFSYWYDDHKKRFRDSNDENSQDPGMKKIDAKFSEYDRIKLDKIVDSMTEHDADEDGTVINVEELDKLATKAAFEADWLEKVAYENFVDSGVAKLITTVDIPHHANIYELREMAKPWLLRQYIVRMDDKHMSVYEMPEKYTQDKLAGVKYEL